jgi:hypothetical protein
MTATAVLGCLAAVVGVADTLPYLRDMRRGTTRPHRGTWLVWSIVAIVAFWAQRASGATWSLVMLGTQAVLTSATFLLSLRHGEGGLGHRDLTLLGIAAGGLTGWAFVDLPVIATAGVVVADLVGAMLMLPKAYRDPQSETPSTYVLAALGGGLAACAVAEPDPELLLFPVYFTVVNGALAAVILRRRAICCASALRV